MKTLAWMIVLGALPLVAAEPPGFTHWTSNELRAFDGKLAPKMNDKKFASEQLGKFGNHYAMVAHREGSGLAELHESDADLFVVESGSATLVVGGKVVDGKAETAGEIRGPSIDGGSKKRLSAGDIVHIPANVPHQLLVDPGHKFTYFVMKVSQK